MNIRRAFDILILRLKSLTVKNKLDSELQRELAFHFDRQVEENIANGMPPDEARAAAKRSFGGPAQIQEECRDMRRTNQWETIVNDIRYAVRTLTRTPAFTLAIVLTLALAVGANSAIFSVIRGVLLRPLPYPQPDRLVRIYFESDTQPKFPLNPNDLRDFRNRNRSFDNVAGMVRHDVQLSGNGGEPVPLRGFAVTSGYFRTLGLTPARGRDFASDDELKGRGRSVVLSDRLWRIRFAADPGILGRALTLNSEPFQVIGIMPPGAQHPGNNFQALADGDTVDLWMPFVFDSENNRGSHYMDGIGRLKAGVAREQANADLSAILSQLMNEHTDKGWRVYLIPLYQETVGRSRKMLLVLFGAVGLLLLIACVNAANLLLARSSARVREIAVRSALGAARLRIIRQLLTESLVISLAAAALGTLLATVGVRALVHFLPPAFPRASEIRLETGVFAFTLLVAVVTGLLFGLVPALTASRADLQQSLRENGRSASATAPQLRLRNVLVIGETALACLLLVAAGLMLHSFINLLNIDPGFHPQQVLTASLSLPQQRYRTDRQCVQFFDRLLLNLKSLPGVQSAGVGSDLPWTGDDNNADGFQVEGHPDLKTTARYHVASPDYFQSLGIPLIRGRVFDGHEKEHGPILIVVNESMASRYWPGEDAVGKRISYGMRPDEKDWMRIIGVVRDIKDQPDSTSVRPALWFTPIQQSQRGMFLAVRSSANPEQLTNQIRLAVRQADPELAVSDLRLMNEIAYQAFSTQRFALFLIGLFALLALALATFGIYGVISYSASQRQHEFGIRMALGAEPTALVRTIVGQGLKLSLIGIALGMLFAAGVVRLLGSLLYGVQSTDPASFAIVAAVTLVTAAVACYLPARRVVAADPIRCLHAE